MPYKFFQVSVRDPATEEMALNAFLGCHRILSVDRRWVDQGQDSFWAICVDFQETSSTSVPGRSSRSKGKDYKDLLTSEDFAVFARLRDLRKEIAQAEAVPVYTIFTNRAQDFSRRFPFFLKLDIRKYFDSVPHAELLNRLERLFKDPAVLALFADIVHSFRRSMGRGLPIGSLTSQHFANFYLGWFDRFINRSSQGLDFLGCRVFSWGLTLNRRSRVRFGRKLKHLENEHRGGWLSESELQRRATALSAFSQAADVASWRFRQRVLQQLEVSGHKAQTG